MKTQIYKWAYGKFKPNGFIVEKEETKSKTNENVPKKGKT